MSIPELTHSSPLSYGSGPNDTDETVGAPLSPLAKFAILIGASIVAGSMALYFGSVSQFLRADSWYEALTQPGWNPRNGSYVVMWIGMYAVIAVAAWRIWCIAAGAERNAALWLYAGQLALSALWWVLFFWAESPGLALIDMVALLSAISGVTLGFWRLDRFAGALMIPYLAWVIFATVLNAALWWLNR